MHIAFIGVGHMGGPMARNLMKAGYAVTAFDVSAAMLDPIVAAGAARASSANQAAHKVALREVYVVVVE